MFARGRKYKEWMISPLQFVILILLRQRPMYGYEVLKALRDEFGEFWNPQTGSIYPAIKKLEDHGLVVGENREGTDYYSISPEGSEWVFESLRAIPRDIRFFTRYLDFLGKAETELLSKEMEPPADGSGCGRPSFDQIFEEDDEDEKERIRRLLDARNHISAHLAKINEELKTLEAHSERLTTKGVKRE